MFIFFASLDFKVIQSRLFLTPVEDHIEVTDKSQEDLHPALPLRQHCCARDCRLGKSFL